MAYKPKSNIGRVLNRNTGINKRPKYEYLNSGVYQLWCQDCSLVYTGETGRQFHVRYKEYALAYKKKIISAYAQHLINHGHSVGHMEDGMDVIFTIHKVRHLDTVEIYRIYKKTEQGVQINDERNITKNKIFDVIVQYDSQYMAW